MTPQSQNNPAFVIDEGSARAPVRSAVNTRPAHAATARTEYNFIARPARVAAANREAAPLLQTPIRVAALTRLCTFMSVPHSLVVDRFLHGADLGVEGSPGAHFCLNNRSAFRHRTAVTPAVAREVAAGVTRGPFSSPPFPSFRVNPISARPKPDGSVRIILDLSQPRGDAVNDYINIDRFHVQYTSIDELIRHIFINGGRGSMLFKADIAAAFKLIPVHPSQFRWLGFCWEGSFYYQTALPFGCRSSPRIFNDFAECLAALTRRSSGHDSICNYLDDFFGVGPPNSPQAGHAFNTFLRVCEEIGVPLAEQKCVPPTTHIEILGVSFDTTTMTLALPAEKVQDIIIEIESLGVDSGPPVSKRKLLSIAGKLANASRCIPPGRAFVRRLLDAAHSVAGLSDTVLLSTDARADLLWWHRFLPQWNGLFPLVNIDVPATLASAVFTDSSRVGMGAWFYRHWWAQPWPTDAVEGAPCMTFLEMLPVFVACLIWSESWRGHWVIVYSDNMGVVGSLRRGWSAEPRTMCLIRHVLYLAAVHGYRLEARFVFTGENEAADALSRQQWARFHTAAPEAHRTPVQVPAGVKDLLADPFAGAARLTGVTL